MDDHLSPQPPPEPPPPEPQREDEGQRGDEDILPQLVAILTARWRTEDGRLAIGAPRRRLLEALRVDDERLEFLLHTLADRVAPLGLELRDYRKAGDTWCCLTAVRGGPVELDDAEQGVLGLLIHLVLKSGRRKCARMDDVRETLVGRDYMTEHQLQNILRRLDHYGYIRRSRGTIALDSRTRLEFDETAQKEIAEQARVLIL